MFFQILSLVRCGTFLLWSFSIIFMSFSTNIIGYVKLHRIHEFELISNLILLNLLNLKTGNIEKIAENRENLHPVEISRIIIPIIPVWGHVVNGCVFARSNKCTFQEGIHDSTHFIFGICYTELVMDSI